MGGRKMHQYQISGNICEVMSDYTLLRCAATINGVTTYFLVLLKAGQIFDKTLPHPAETCSGVQSSVSAKLKEIPLC